ncbi:Uncharacterised protein [Bordetella pertussis]|nr:Uncharacterised protein [Bordetella pertussis]
MPASALDCTAELPISSYESWRNSSPKPSMVLSNKGSMVWAVQSRGVKPVPPDTRMTWTSGSAIHSLMTRRIW